MFTRGRERQNRLDDASAELAETTLPLGGRAYNRLVGRLSAEARRTYDLLLDSYYKTSRHLVGAVL